MVQDAAFTGCEEEEQPYKFGWDLDQNGNPVVDNGSDEKPFLVGVSSRALLQRLDREPRSFILHVDATFKLNQVSYPVLVIGMSDRERRFHLLAVVVLSQIVEEMYTKALAALRRVFEAVTNKPLRVYYVMGDADDGQFNSVKNGFGRDNQYVCLMCFFHVMKNVNDRLKGIDEHAANRVRKDIYDLHFAENRSDFVRLFYSILPRWRGDPSTAAFAIYFKKVWLTGKFIRWQSFQSPSAYATTNNPAEQFNRVIKRDYTLRAKLKMDSLLRQLQECCRNETERAHDFGITPKATGDLERRSKEMDRKSLLQDANIPEDEEVFASNPVVNVLSVPAERIYIQSKNRTEKTTAITAQMGVNYARMEFEGMPNSGWTVNVDLCTCECRYFRKFAVSVHLLFAMRHRSHVDCNGNEMLVNRSRSRKRRQQNGNEPGRPALNGHSLDRE